MPSNGHAGCGGRARETGRSKYRHRALARPYPLGSAPLLAAWQADREGGGIPGRERMPGKQMPAAERQQESGQRGRFLRRPSRITGRIPGLVPGRESALTCGR